FLKRIGKLPSKCFCIPVISKSGFTGTSVSSRSPVARNQSSIPRTERICSALVSTPLIIDIAILFLPSVHPAPIRKSVVAECSNFPLDVREMRSHQFTCLLRIAALDCVAERRVVRYRSLSHVRCRKHFFQNLRKKRAERPHSEVQYAILRGARK